MTHHLSPLEIVDATEGTLSESRQGHAAHCDVCQEAVASLVESVQRLKLDEMPEPSPLFWDHFQRRVQEAVELETPPTPTRYVRRPWWRWQSSVAAVVTVASVVIGVAWYAGGGRALLSSADEVQVSVGAAPVVTVDAEWEFVTNVLGTLEPDDVQRVLAPSPRAVDAAFEGLTEEERENFFRLLRAEMTAGME